MVKKSTKSKSKRMTLKHKYKVIKKVKEHHRKKRKEENKKKRLGIKPKAAKDPGIPAAWPFKDELVKEIQFTRHQMQQQAQERRERLKRQREEEADEDMGDEATALQAIQQGAQAKLQQFENGKRPRTEAEDPQDASRRAFFKEFVKVVEASDVLIEVLDARDPQGCRCPEVERFVRKKDPSKRIILLLNKIDLVPREVAAAWLKYLREELPTVAFKCSTQQQATNLGRGKGSKKKVLQQVEGGDGGSVCLGAEQLLQLLKNYTRNQNIKTSITVGIIGLPNVGKSSLINSLKRTRVAAVGNMPGMTKAVQEVHLDKHVKLLDSPGIVFSSEAGSDAATVALRNAVRIEQLEDPVAPVRGILERCNAKQLMAVYAIPAFTDVDEFLLHVANARGKLKKGGSVDLEAAARMVLQDWNEGKKLKYYTVPPQRNSAVEGSAVVLHEWGRDFQLDAIEEGERAVVEGLPSLEDVGAAQGFAQVTTQGVPDTAVLEDGLQMNGSANDVAGEAEGISDDDSEGPEVDEGAEDMDDADVELSGAVAKKQARLDNQQAQLYEAHGQFNPHAARAQKKKAKKAKARQPASALDANPADDAYDFAAWNAADLAAGPNAFNHLAVEGDVEGEGGEAMSGSDVDA